MYIMCVILCLFSALSRREGALISIIIISIIASDQNNNNLLRFNKCVFNRGKLYVTN